MRLANWIPKSKRRPKRQPGKDRQGRVYPALVFTMTEIPAVLAQLLSLVEADPRSGQALVLYALAKTLDVPRGGHMFMLKKLADLDAENRQLAYGLIELMVSDGARGPAWEQAMTSLDSAISGRT